MEGRRDESDDTGAFYFRDESTGREPPQASQVVRPPSKRAPAGLVGIVRGKLERSESQRIRYPDRRWGETTLTVVSFRVDQFDKAGNRTSSIPVEMRGFAFTGHLADGDTVEIHGRAVNGVVYTESVQNRTTGSIFSVAPQRGVPRHPKTRGALKAFGCLLTTVLILIGLLFVATTSGWLRDPSQETPATVTIPNITGENIVNGHKLLERAGVPFNDIYTSDKPSSFANFGNVLGTDPPAGSKVKVGTVVRMYVGDGRSP
jgi:hypothetical protein